MALILLLNCCLIKGMYQSWRFLFQMTKSPSEAAKVDNGKFIGSYNPSDEKAEVDPISEPEAKDSDLFGSMFYLLNLPVSFLPSDHFLHMAKDTALGYVAHPWSLCLEKERGSLIKT